MDVPMEIGLTTCIGSISSIACVVKVLTILL